MRLPISALSIVIPLAVVPLTAQQGQNPLLTPNPYVSPPEVKGGSVPRLPDGHPDMQGVWLPRQPGNTMAMLSVEAIGGPRPRKGVIVDPSDGKIPYQPWALAKRNDIAKNHMLEESDAHCLLGGFPHQSFTPFAFRLLQPPDNQIVQVWEFMHAYRVVFMDGRPHLDPQTRLFMGDSRGHWEGDTLVIDITNQKARPWIEQAGDFHSDAIHVVERLTPIDSNNIAYEALIEDPKVYTKPWKIAYFYSRVLDPKYEALEFACIEGEADLSKH